MNVEYQIINENDVLVFDSIHPSNLHYIEKLMKENSSNDLEELYNTIKINKCRASIIKKSKITVLCITKDKSFFSSSPKMRTFLNVIVDSFKYTEYAVEKRVQEETDKINLKTSRLLHNLRSLNAHNIQEIFSLIPQDVLAKKYKGQLRQVRDLIQEDLNDAALCILKIAKNNTAIKTEFSVFDKLFNPNPILNFNKHNVHKVVMNTLYLFFPDFTDNEVTVDVSKSNLYAFFDYESIHVALFHLIDNAVKYIKPSSTINISILDLDGTINLMFKMCSLVINDEEKNRIFDEGYSGEASISSGKSGSGIGLNMVKRILELNYANIEVCTDVNSRTQDEQNSYQKNVFIVRLRRESVR